jgi:phage terminase large subunit
MQTARAERETDLVMAELMRHYMGDPVFFCEHALGHMTWSKQREILRFVRDSERTAVRASHSVSKTYSAAEVAIWFLNCIPNSKVITTAPTWTQMKMLLWSEIGSGYARSRIKLEGECLMTEIKTEEKDHYAIGFSTDKPARAEGWHAPAILFIFDEAKGLPQWLWDAAQGSMTGGFCRWLAISTTDGVQVGEQFWKIFQGEHSDWNRIHISAYDTPYVTGEKFRTIEIPDPTRPDIFKVKHVDPKDIVFQIATPKWIEGRKKEWGEDSVLFQTKVKGEIADAGADSIIKLSQVQQMIRNAADEKFDSAGQEEIGVDVARGGTDDTVMFHRKGLKVIDEKVLATPQLPEKAKLVYIADVVERFAGYNKKVRIKPDDTGVGGGVVDILQSRGYNIVPVCFGAEASEPDKYPNVISEMWFEVGKIVHEIACAADDRLQAELVNRKSKPLDKKGRRVVESKDDYKGRGFRSPDKADAFLLTFYNPQNVVNIRSLRS